MTMKIKQDWPTPVPILRVSNPSPTPDVAREMNPDKGPFSDHTPDPITLTDLRRPIPPPKKIVAEHKAAPESVPSPSK